MRFEKQSNSFGRILAVLPCASFPEKAMISKLFCSSFPNLDGFPCIYLNFFAFQFTGNTIASTIFCDRKVHCLAISQKYPLVGSPSGEILLNYELYYHLVTAFLTISSPYVTQETTATHPIYIHMALES